MKLHHHRLWLAIFVGAAGCLSTHTASANITGFSGFAAANQVGEAFDTAVGYNANGTSFTPTDTTNGESSSGFYPTPQGILGFTASFNYQITPGANTANGTIAADGIALIFQNSASGTAALGGGGAGIGYGAGDAGMAITPSAALEFDVFGGAYSFPGSTGFGLNGTIATNTAATTNRLTGPNVSTGHPLSVLLSYSGTSLTETVTDTTNTALTNTFTYTGINLQSVLGGSTALVGFSGATGGYNATQTISNFTFTSVPEPGTWVTMIGGACLLGLTLHRRAWLA